MLGVEAMHRTDPLPTGRERLRWFEDAFDPGTTKYLSDLGVAPGWHCLELGGGGGSIAAWLCARVGPTGRVVATDLDTRFLEAIDCPPLEVWRHELGADDLPEAMFDLIHIRAVLSCLPRRERAIDQIVGALRPGGRVLIEEPDYTSEAMIGQPGAALDRACKLMSAKNRLLAAHGFDTLFARKVALELIDRGLAEVAAEGRVAITRGGSPLARFYQASMLDMPAEGKSSLREIKRYCECIANPAYVCMWPMMVATWGRKAL
jgi:SAM-dependent methyltransferase